MRQTRDGSSSVDVVIGSECIGEALTLNYFFTIGFGQQTQLVTQFEEINQPLLEAASPQLFVLLVSTVGEREIQTIRDATASSVKPFILVVNRDQAEESSLKLFKAGANEVLRTPYSLSELAFRLQNHEGAIGATYRFDASRLEGIDNEADVASRAELTEAEAQIFRVLMGREGKTVTRDELSLAIDNSQWNYGNRKFDVHVAQIRKKLQGLREHKLQIKTVRAAGYQLTYSDRQ